MSNTIDCPACGFGAAKVSATKTGGYSVSCSDCGYQGFAKSPKAAAGLQSKLKPGNGAPAGGEPKAAAKKDFLSDL